MTTTEPTPKQAWKEVADLNRQIDQLEKTRRDTEQMARKIVLEINTLEERRRRLIAIAREVLKR